MLLSATESVAEQNMKDKMGGTFGLQLTLLMEEEVKGWVGDNHKNIFDQRISKSKDVCPLLFYDLKFLNNAILLRKIIIDYYNG